MSRGENVTWCRMTLSLQAGRRLGAATLIFFLMCVGMGFGSTAASLGAPELANLPSGLEVAPFEVQAYREEFGLSPEIAEQHLITQQRGAGAATELEAVEGKQYAGVWFDNDSGEFVVPMASGTSRPAINTALADANVDDHARIQTVLYSWSELEAAQKKLDESLRPALEKGLVETALDPKTNAVVAIVAAQVTPAELAEIKRVGLSVGVSVETQLTGASTVAVETLAAHLNSSLATDLCEGELELRKVGVGVPSVRPASRP